MRPTVRLNDAWDSIDLEFVDSVIDFLDYQLQPSHPLRAYKLFPLAKRFRMAKYLIEEEEPSDMLWVLDLDRKKRIRGKTCYYFKRIETQEELDSMLKADYEEWVQFMKDQGAWFGD